MPNSSTLGRLLRHPLPWIFLLALAVRLVGLTYHSLWFDEVVSTVWAAKPAGEIWRTGLALAQDKHPPLYYLLLHAWTRLFGEGDEAVRWLGVLIGALAVLPVYDIGRRLGGRRAGATGALLLALNPFLVWYSQEARMFMPATTFVLVGLAGVLRVVAEHPGARRAERAGGCEAPRSPKGGVGEWRVAGGGWLRSTPEPEGRSGRMASGVVLLIGGFVAALYSYLFSAFMLPVAAVWLALLWWQGRGAAGNTQRFLVAAAALAVAVLVFLPLARNAWLVSGEEAAPGQVFGGMAGALPSLLAIYAVGWPGWAARVQPWLALGAALLALAGLAVPDRFLYSHPRAVSNPKTSASSAPLRSIRAVGDDENSIRLGGLYLAVWLAVPLLIGGMLLARDRTIFAETRYFIFLVPALCLAWGRALAALWTWRRAAGWIGLAAAVALTALALPANWSPERRREAWREAAAYVQAQARPNDALLFYPDYILPAFDRYFDGPQGVFFPFTDALNDPAQVDAPLQGLAGFDAVWLIQSHHEELDPNGVLPGWFAARYPLITEQFPPGIDVRGFATQVRLPALPAGVAASTPPAALGGLTLLACQHDSGPLPPHDDVFHPPSNYVHVTTYWTVDAPPPADVFPTVQMVDAAGQVWGDKLERGGDAIHLWPTSRWQPDEVVRVDYDVNLNPVTLPGTYQIVLSLPGTDEKATCGSVTIE